MIDNQHPKIVSILTNFSVLSTSGTIGGEPSNNIDMLPLRNY